MKKGKNRLLTTSHNYFTIISSVPQETPRDMEMGLSSQGKVCQSLRKKVRVGHKRGGLRATEEKYLPSSYLWG